MRFIGLALFIVHKDRLHSYMYFIRLLQTVLVILIERYGEYNNCPISFLSFSELFPVFICAKVLVIY